MRLDKYICDTMHITRSQAKKDLKNGLVTVNGQKQVLADYKIDENIDRVMYKGEICAYENFVYYMLYKPAGVVSATEDRVEKTVLDLLPHDKRRKLFPVGRLDKDTEGLIILTDDGTLAHELLTPKKHVEKEYECVLEKPIDMKQIEDLEKGVDIGEKEMTRPAIVKKTEDLQKIRLIITEGKFHQVKRMLKAVGNEVLYLKRIRMGNLLLDESLGKGNFRKLTQEELGSLKINIS